MEEKYQDDRQAEAAVGGEQAAEADTGGMKDSAAELDAKTRELDESNNRLLRLQADFDNFRRRSQKEKEELSQVVAGEVFRELLPVLDNFERALAAPGEDAAQVRTGVAMIYRQFGTIMERFGVKPIEAVGSPFDPARHEAVLRVEDAAQPDGQVVEELQKGYEINGRVLRASMVKVVGNS